MKVARLGNQINEKKLAKQCAIHVVSKSFKNKKRTLTYMGIDKWGKEVWEYLD